MKSCGVVGGEMICEMIRKSYLKIPYIEDFKHKVLQSTTLQKFKYVQTNPSELTHQVCRNAQNQENDIIQSVRKHFRLKVGCKLNCEITKYSKLEIFVKPNMKMRAN